MELHRTLAQRLLGYADFERPSPLVRKDAFQQQSLTLASFSSVMLQSNERTQMVWFYADWCGHCHKMKAAWEDAQRRGGAHDWHVVDCAKEGASLAEKMEVRSFPAVKRVRMSQIEHFQGDRTADGLITFAEE